MSISPAQQAFDALFITPSQAAQICDAALTDAATRLVQSTGANGNLFPILDRLARSRTAARSKASFGTRGPRTSPVAGPRTDASCLQIV
jgi:hypothetical protein